MIRCAEAEVISVVARGRFNPSNSCQDAEGDEQSPYRFSVCPEANASHKHSTHMVHPATKCAGTVQQKLTNLMQFDVGWRNVRQ
jgi:hypothetical protein